jgi:hypothetical protein
MFQSFDIYPVAYPIACAISVTHKVSATLEIPAFLGTSALTEISGRDVEARITPAVANPGRIGCCK